MYYMCVYVYIHTGMNVIILLRGDSNPNFLQRCLRKVLHILFILTKHRAPGSLHKFYTVCLYLGSRRYSLYEGKMCVIAEALLHLCLLLLML